MNEEFIKSQIKWNKNIRFTNGKKNIECVDRDNIEIIRFVSILCAYRHFYFLILYQRSININIFSHICIVNRKYCYQYEHLTDLKFFNTIFRPSVKKEIQIAQLPNEF